ncbi:MAG: hypothetical protein WCG87_07370, partial [Bacteroidota bacterium]
METILTIEEVEILESILKHIPFEKPFKVEILYYEYILKVIIFPDDMFGVNIRVAHQDLMSRNVYMHIYVYLLENAFAIKTDNVHELLLTLKGKALVGFKSLKLYREGLKYYYNDELKDAVNKSISQLAPYGEFSLRPSFPSNYMNPNDVHNPIERAKYEY